MLKKQSDVKSSPIKISEDKAILRESYKYTMPLTLNEFLCAFLDVADEAMSKYETPDRAFIAEEHTFKMLEDTWKKRGSYNPEKGSVEVWVRQSAVNYAKDLLDAKNEYGEHLIPDSVGISTDSEVPEGKSIIFGYHGAKNQLTERAFFNHGVYTSDFLTAEICADNERQSISLRHTAHSVTAEMKQSFDCAMSQALSTLSPDNKRFYELYNEGLKTKEILVCLNSEFPGQKFNANCLSTRKTNTIIPRLDKELDRNYVHPAACPKSKDEALAMFKQEIKFFSRANKSKVSK